MESKRCLICLKDIYSSLSVTPSPFLSKDLHIIFVLRNLLEVPCEKLSRILAHHGNPSEWTFYAFCAQCGEAVENAKRIYQEIIDASRIFRAVKGEIVETLKRNWRRQKKCAGGRSLAHSSKIQNNETESVKNANIIEETQVFIFNHDYGPSSDPFLDGDLLASDLCATRSELKVDTDGLDDIFVEETVKWEREDEANEDFYEEVSGLLEMPTEDVPDEPGKANFLLVPNDVLVDVPATSFRTIFDKSIKQQPPLHKSKAFRRRKPSQIMGKDGKLRNKQVRKSFKKIKVTNTDKPHCSKTRPSEKQIFRCEYKNCDKSYSAKYKLRVHLMQHSGEKPFQCSWPECSWKFTRLDVLKRHYIQHFPDKPFKCDFCPWESKRRDNLSRHLEAFHSKQVSNGKPALFRQQVHENCS